MGEANHLRDVLFYIFIFRIGLRVHVQLEPPVDLLSMYLNRRLCAFYLLFELVLFWLFHMTP